MVQMKVGLVLQSEEQEEEEQGQTRCLGRQQMECSQPRQFGPARPSYSRPSTQSRPQHPRACGPGPRR